MEMGKDPDYGPARCDHCASTNDTQLVIFPDCSGKYMCSDCRWELRYTLKALDEEEK